MSISEVLFDDDAQRSCDAGAVSPAADSSAYFNRAILDVNFDIFHSPWIREAVVAKAAKRATRLEPEAAEETEDRSDGV